MTHLDIYNKGGTALVLTEAMATLSANVEKSGQFKSGFTERILPHSVAGADTLVDSFGKLFTFAIVDGIVSSDLLVVDETI